MKYKKEKNPKDKLKEGHCTWLEEMEAKNKQLKKINDNIKKQRKKEKEMVRLKISDRKSLMIYKTDVRLKEAKKRRGYYEIIAD